MAMATVDPSATATATSESDRPFHLDSIPTVDLRLLSQTELYSLSLCTDSSFDPRRCDDVVIPKIDRSVFNESAGSRKQTYSRLRLAPAAASSSSSSAPPSSSSLHRRTVRSLSPNPLLNIHSHPDDYENSQIILLLNQLFSNGETSAEVVAFDKVHDGCLVPVRVDYSDSIPQLANVDSVPHKRKRGRPRKSRASLIPVEPLLGTTADDVTQYDVSCGNADGTEKEMLKNEGESISLVAVGEERDVPNNKGESVDLGTLGEQKQVLNDKAESVDLLAPMKEKQVLNNRCESMDFLALRREKEVLNNIDEPMDFVALGREKEVLNDKGKSVDLVALAGLEDPYKETLRRRTQGLMTEDQIMGFLSGLFGQWGCKTMKKKIVDASEFGDTLPKGWRLMLSVDKKDDRVCLSCSRYISPNGRQFVSCKEVSSYLLSIIGLQDANQIDCGPEKQKIQTGKNTTSVYCPSISIQDYNKIENPLSQLSSPLSSISGYHENLETSKSVDPPEVKQGEYFKCEKCQLTFNEKDDLLQHQLTSHRRKRSKIGSSITDGVIIKGGKYECQFCHKTFEERNRYNGHVGTHVKNYVKIADETIGVDFGKNISALSSVRLTQTDYMMQASMPMVIESNVAESLVVNSSNIEAHSGNRLQLFAERNENSLAKESRSAYDQEFVKTNKVMETGQTAKSILCLASSPTLLNNDNHKNEASGEVMTTECSEIFGQRSSSESCLRSPVASTRTCVAEENATRLSAGQEAVSESCLVSHNRNQEEMEIENVSFEKFKPMFRVCDDQAAKNHNSMVELKQYDNFEVYSLEPSFNGPKIRNPDYANGRITSMMVESDCERISESCVLASSGKETGAVDAGNKLPTINFSEPRLYGTFNLRKNGCENFSISGKDVTCRQDEHVERSPIILSNAMQEQVSDHHRNDVSACIEEIPKTKEDFESSSLTLAGYQQNCGVEDYVDRRPMKKIDELRVAEIQDFFNNEFIPSASSYREHGANPGSNSKQEFCLEVCAPGLPGNEQDFEVRDYATGIYTNQVEEHKQERSEMDLFSQFCFQEPSDDVYVSNKMYTPTANEPKHDHLQNFRSQQLSLTFGNFHEGLSTNFTGAERDSYTANCSTTPCIIGQPCGIQTNLGSSNRSSYGDPRQKSSPFNGLCSSSYGDDTRGFVDNVNYGSRVWDRPQVDEVRNFRNQFMFPFGSGYMQPVGNVVKKGMWKTHGDNLLQSDLVPNSSPVVQSSSSFHTFEIISNKGQGEDGCLKPDSEFPKDPDFGGLRSVRNEPVEFSFLTAQDSNSLAGDSKVFSYHSGMEQGYGSSFWLGKESLMENIAGRSPATVCAWCKNEFYHETMHSGAQTGTIGSLCPTCSGRFSVS